MAKDKRAVAQDLEPTNKEIMKKVNKIYRLVETLFEAAKSGGKIVAPVNYEKLHQFAAEIPASLVDCHDPCLNGGPCPLGRKQARACFTFFKKEHTKRKKWRLFQQHMPFKKSQLRRMPRKDLISLGAMLGLNPFDYTGDQLLKAVRKAQKKWVKKNKILLEEAVPNAQTNPVTPTVDAPAAPEISTENAAPTQENQTT